MMKLSDKFVILTMVLSLACVDKKIIESKSEAVTPDSNVIMPLELGHRWDGIYKYVSHEGQEETTSVFLTYEITDTMTVKNILFYYWRGISDDSSFLFSSYYALGHSGLLEMEFLFEQPPAVYLLVKYPANLNDTFPSGPYDRFRVTVESIDTIRIRNLNKHNCPTITYKYHKFFPGVINGIDEYYYFSPGIGEVKWEIINHYTEPFYQCWEMSSFIPNDN